MEFLNTQLHGDVLLWMLLGISFLSAEPFTGSFHLLFVGLAALVTAAIAGLGLTYMVVQLAIFSGLSFLSWILMHQRLKFTSSEPFRIDPTKPFALSRSLDAGQTAEILYQGALWDARHAGAAGLAAGAMVRVTRIDGPALVLEA